MVFNGDICLIFIHFFNAILKWKVFCYSFCVIVDLINVCSWWFFFMFLLCFPLKVCRNHLSPIYRCCAISTRTNILLLLLMLPISLLNCVWSGLFALLKDIFFIINCISFSKLVNSLTTGGKFLDRNQYFSASSFCNFPRKASALHRIHLIIILFLILVVFDNLPLMV